MKTVKSLQYLQDEVIVKYEEDGVLSVYKLIKVGAEWKGESKHLDSFFKPLLRKGELQ